MSKDLSYNQVNILLIEDDEIDAEIVRRAFKQLRIANPVTRARNGQEGLDILRNNTIDKPRIVLLDLNMPVMNGFEFLDAIRDDDDIKDTVIFVLTTSKSQADLLAAYKKNIAGYIVKSELDSGFESLINMLTSYWRIIELPAHEEPN
ncbi:response regulator [Reinekea forsetii]|nr:response regulator [Reinekea forsetii]